MVSLINHLLLPVLIIPSIVKIGFHFKLPIIVFQINSISLIESEEFREISIGMPHYFFK